MNKFLIFCILAVAASTYSTGYASQGVEMHNLCTLDKPIMSNGVDVGFIVPTIGLFVQTRDGVFKSCDAEKSLEIDEFMLLDNLWYDQVIAKPDCFIVLSSQSVYSIDSIGCNPLVEFATPSVRLFDGADNSFYAVVYGDTTSIIYSVGRDGSSILLANAVGAISRVVPTGEGFLFSVADCINYCINDKIDTVVKFDGVIQDFTLGRNGIIAATDAGLFQVSDDKFMLLAEPGPVRSILNDGNRIYLLLNNKTVLYYDED